MKRYLLIMGIVLVALVLFSLSIWAQAEEEAQYIGAAKCKMCHQSAKQGEIYKKWEAGPHAKAFADLATDRGKEVAAEAGVEGDPQQAAECLECHVTAFNAPAEAKASSYTLEDGVGCESCHGPGSLYKSMKVMRELRAGTQDADAVAYVKGDEKTCLTCHNEKSPTYIPFKYDEKWAMIAHPIPEAAE